MKFGYILKYDEKQNSIADVTLSNHVKYCNKHNYKLIIDTSPWIPNRNGMWMKWQALINALKDETNSDIDWFFWSDIDVLIMNQDITLNNLLELIDKNKYHIVVSKWNIPYNSYENLRDKFITESSKVDSWFTIHTGNFFVKNCKWSLNFIKTVIEDKRFVDIKSLRDHPTGDEIGFTIYYMGYPEYRNYIGFLPNELLHTVAIESKNSANKKWKIYEKGDFVFHAVMLPVSEKIKLLKEYKEKLNVNYSSAV